jgi:regulator of protease activity HflC (stomatin/prohibitin superfamily)
LNRREARKKDVRTMNDPREAEKLPVAGNWRLFRSTFARCRLGGVVGITACAIAIVGWLITGMASISEAEIGVYQRLGRNVAVVKPGLHFGLPLPFGRVVRVPQFREFSCNVGFQADWKDVTRNGLMWTRHHGVPEPPMLCGTTTEIIVINATVVYQLKPLTLQRQDFLSQAVDCHQVLQHLAQHIVNRHCNRLSADHLISGDRRLFSEKLKAELQEAADYHQLGLDVAAFGILSLHPPIEVSASYLDVASAATDAQRELDTARISAGNELLRVQVMCDSEVADAKVTAAKRVTVATQDEQMMTSLGLVYGAAGEALRPRLLSKTDAEILKGKSVVILDANLPTGVKVLLTDEPVTISE